MEKLAQKLTTLIKPDKIQYSTLRSRTRVTRGCLLASGERIKKKLLSPGSQTLPGSLTRHYPSYANTVCADLFILTVGKVFPSVNLLVSSYNCS